MLEVQALEALRDSMISISVILMRSLGKLLLFECALKLIVTDPSGLEIQSIRHDSFHYMYAGSLLFVLCKFLLSQCVSLLISGHLVGRRKKFKFCVIFRDNFAQKQLILQEI